MISTRRRSMKRYLVRLGTSLFGLALTGCASDPRGDAVSTVVTLMELAAGDVGTITKEVDKALKKQKEENVAFDLNDAIKATKALEMRGKEVQKAKTEQAARPELRKAAKDWTDVKAKTALLPPPEKAEKDRLAKEYKGKMDDAIKKYYGEVGRVFSFQAGKEVLMELKPVVVP